MFGMWPDIWKTFQSIDNKKKTLRNNVINIQNVRIRINLLHSDSIQLKNAKFYSYGKR